MSAKMEDEIDVYLSRSLKNWAAKHTPPLRGKERLLRAAAELPRLYNKKNPYSVYFIALVAPQSHPWSLHPAFMCAAHSLWPWPSRLV